MGVCYTYFNMFQEVSQDHPQSASQCDFETFIQVVSQGGILLCTHAAMRMMEEQLLSTEYGATNKTRGWCGTAVSRMRNQRTPEFPKKITQN